MPPEVNEPTIFIVTPNGTSNVINPFYNYTFHPQPSNTDFPPNVGSVRSFITAWPTADAGRPIANPCGYISLVGLR